MTVTLKELERKDYDKAIDFAITGMHFERYTENKTLLKIYGRYFLYLEMSRATQIICAYEDDQLIGILMAVIKGEKKKYKTFWKNLYVKGVGFFMDHFMGSAASPYDAANQSMLTEYKKTHQTDGEICFLAADPNTQGKGIGSMLLKELQRREPDKHIYLFTDNNCTYQFYEHKGFERVGEKEILMDIAGNNVPLTCLLYAKKL